MKTAEHLQPLKDEIKRLFILVKNENPNQTLKYYTLQIQPDVDNFISLNSSSPYNVGSRDDKTGNKDTFGYINRQISRMNKELKL